MKNFRNLFASLVAMFVLAFCFAAVEPAAAAATNCIVSGTAVIASNNSALAFSPIYIYDTNTNVAGHVADTDAFGNYSLSLWGGQQAVVYFNDPSFVVITENNQQTGSATKYFSCPSMGRVTYTQNWWAFP